MSNKKDDMKIPNWVIRKIEQEPEPDAKTMARYRETIRRCLAQEERQQAAVKGLVVNLAGSLLAKAENVIRETAEALAAPVLQPGLARGGTKSPDDKPPAGQEEIYKEEIGGAKVCITIDRSSIDSKTSFVCKINLVDCDNELNIRPFTLTLRDETGNEENGPITIDARRTQPITLSGLPVGIHDFCFNWDTGKKKGVFRLEIRDE